MNTCNYGVYVIKVARKLMPSKQTTIFYNEFGHELNDDTYPCNNRKHYNYGQNVCSDVFSGILIGAQTLALK